MLHNQFISVWGAICFLFVTIGLQAQPILFSYSIPSDVGVCSSPETFSVNFKNNKNTTIRNIRVLIELPTGIIYEGNLVETSGFNLQEEDVSNSANLLFTTDDIPKGQTVSFRFDVSAGLVALAQQEAGITFRNEIEVTYNNQAKKKDATGPYGVVFPQLEITTINPEAVNVGLQESFSRSISISNTGSGPLDHLTLYDIHSADLVLLSSDIGTLNGEEISLIGTDFQNIGNMDAQLDPNETITITQNFKLLGCTDVLSEVYTTWECEAEILTADTKFTETRVRLQFDPQDAFSAAKGIGLDVANDSWGTAWGDYDNDGDPDLFITNYQVDHPNQLFENKGDGTFAQVTTGEIVTDLASSIGASWADYDNDGDLDLLVSNNIGFNNFLYRNEGGGIFTSIKNDPIVNERSYSHGISWGDYDNDGFLDLFVAEFFPTRFNLLYHNNGDGTFEQIKSSPISLESSTSVSGAWADYDDDGDLDLFVSNTNDENNRLYRNDGNGQFVSITAGEIVNDGGKSVGASWGDIDNDGDLDLYVCNAGNQNNFLYKNNGDGTFSKIEEESTRMGGNSHGSSFGDYDNDGDLDLLVTNDDDQNNWFFENDGKGNFTSINNAFAIDGGNSLATSWADFDRDGDLDAIVANYGNSSLDFFYENLVGSCFSNVAIKLIGTNSNASGIGAKIKVLATINGIKIWQMREVSAQTGGGLSGQNDLVQLFGLGDASQIEEIMVEWPSGHIQYTGIQNIGGTITILEEETSEVTGVAYYDANGNCRYDDGETLLANAQLKITPGGTYAYTDENGVYTFHVKPGIYSIEEVSIDNWILSCTAVPGFSNYEVNLNQAGRVAGDNDFAHVPDPACAELPDLQVSIATTTLRVGFESLTAIQYQNTGTAAATNTWMSVDFGVHIKPLTASIPWTLSSGSVYTWDLGTVEIGENNTIFVADSVLTTATIGAPAVISGGVESAEADCDGLDNFYTLEGIFTGALDPNDILVSPEGRIAKDQILTYKIRFQNVGNAAVSTVRIINPIPDELDMTTFQMGIVSHSFRFSQDEKGQLIWEFENINLPDSTTNERESHGFITYRIQPIPDLKPGTDISNKADIIFDAQEALSTNIIVNTIEQKIKGNPGKLVLWPNPADALSRIAINPKNVDGEVLVESISVYNMLGQLVYTQSGIGDYIAEIDGRLMNAGCYLIQVIGNDRKLYAGKLIIR